MTTPAFHHVIAINLPTVDRQQELRRVADDLRNERILAAGNAAGPSRVRRVAGEALVSLGEAVASNHRARSVPAR